MSALSERGQHDEPPAQLPAPASPAWWDTILPNGRLGKDDSVILTIRVPREIAHGIGEYLGVGGTGYSSPSHFARDWITKGLAYRLSHGVTPDRNLWLMLERDRLALESRARDAATEIVEGYEEGLRVAVREGDEERVRALLGQVREAQARVGFREAKEKLGKLVEKYG